MLEGLVGGMGPLHGEVVKVEVELLSIPHWAVSPIWIQACSMVARPLEVEGKEVVCRLVPLHRPIPEDHSSKLSQFPRECSPVWGEDLRMV